MPAQKNNRKYARSREIEEIFNVNFMFAHKFEFYNLTAKEGDRFTPHTHRATTLVACSIYPLSIQFTECELCAFVFQERGNGIV